MASTWLSRTLVQSGVVDHVVYGRFVSAEVEQTQVVLLHSGSSLEILAMSPSGSAASICTQGLPAGDAVLDMRVLRGDVDGRSGTGGQDSLLLLSESGRLTVLRYDGGCNRFLVRQVVALAEPGMQARHTPRLLAVSSSGRHGVAAAAFQDRILYLPPAGANTPTDRPLASLRSPSPSSSLSPPPNDTTMIGPQPAAIQNVDAAGLSGSGTAPAAWQGSAASWPPLLADTPLPYRHYITDTAAYGGGGAGGMDVDVSGGVPSGLAAGPVPGSAPRDLRMATADALAASDPRVTAGSAGFPSALALPLVPGCGTIWDLAMLEAECFFEAAKEGRPGAGRREGQGPASVAAGGVAAASAAGRVGFRVAALVHRSATSCGEVLLLHASLTRRCLLCTLVVRLGGEPTAGVRTPPRPRPTATATAAAAAEADAAAEAASAAAAAVARPSPGRLGRHDDSRAVGTAADGDSGGGGGGALARTWAAAARRAPLGIAQLLRAPPANAAAAGAAAAAAAGSCGSVAGMGGCAAGAAGGCEGLMVLGTNGAMYLLAALLGRLSRMPEESGLGAPPGPAAAAVTAACRAAAAPAAAFRSPPREVAAAADAHQNAGGGGGGAAAAAAAAGEPLPPARSPAARRFAWPGQGCSGTPPLGSPPPPMPPAVVYLADLVVTEEPCILEGSSGGGDGAGGGGGGGSSMGREWPQQLCQEPEAAVSGAAAGAEPLRFERSAWGDKANSRRAWKATRGAASRRVGGDEGHARAGSWLRLGHGRSDPGALRPAGGQGDLRPPVPLPPPSASGRGWAYLRFRGSRFDVEEVAATTPAAGRCGGSGGGGGGGGGLDERRGMSSEAAAARAAGSSGDPAVGGTRVGSGGLWSGRRSADGAAMDVDHVGHVGGAGGASTSSAAGRPSDAGGSGSGSALDGSWGMRPASRVGARPAAPLRANHHRHVYDDLRRQPQPQPQHREGPGSGRLTSVPLLPYLPRPDLRRLADWGRIGSGGEGGGGVAAGQSASHVDGREEGEGQGEEEDEEEGRERSSLELDEALRLLLPEQWEMPRVGPPLKQVPPVLGVERMPAAEALMEGHVLTAAEWLPPSSGPTSGCGPAAVAAPVTASSASAAHGLGALPRDPASRFPPGALPWPSHGGAVVQPRGGGLTATEPAVAVAAAVQHRLLVCSASGPALCLTVDLSGWEGGRPGRRAGASRVFHGAEEASRGERREEESSSVAAAAESVDGAAAKGGSEARPPPAMEGDGQGTGISMMDVDLPDLVAEADLDLDPAPAGDLDLAVPRLAGLPCPLVAGSGMRPARAVAALWPGSGGSGGGGSGAGLLVWSEEGGDVLLLRHRLCRRPAAVAAALPGPLGQQAATNKQQQQQHALARRQQNGKQPSASPAREQRRSCWTPLYEPVPRRSGAAGASGRSAYGGGGAGGGVAAAAAQRPLVGLAELAAAAAPAASALPPPPMPQAAAAAAAAAVAAAAELDMDPGGGQVPLSQPQPPQQAAPAEAARGRAGPEAMAPAPPAAMSWCLGLRLLGRVPQPRPMVDFVASEAVAAAGESGRPLQVTGAVLSSPETLPPGGGDGYGDADAPPAAVPVPAAGRACDPDSQLQLLRCFVTVPVVAQAHSPGATPSDIWSIPLTRQPPSRSLMLPKSQGAPPQPPSTTRPRPYPSLDCHDAPAGGSLIVMSFLSASRALAPVLEPALPAAAAVGPAAASDPGSGSGSGLGYGSGFGSGLGPGPGFGLGSALAPSLRDVTDALQLRHWEPTVAAGLVAAGVLVQVTPSGVLLASLDLLSNAVAAGGNGGGGGSAGAAAAAATTASANGIDDTADGASGGGGGGGGATVWELPRSTWPSPKSSRFDDRVSAGAAEGLPAEGPPTPGSPTPGPATSMSVSVSVSGNADGGYEAAGGGGGGAAGGFAAAAVGDAVPCRPLLTDAGSADLAVAAAAAAARSPHFEGVVGDTSGGVPQAALSAAPVPIVRSGSRCSSSGLQYDIGAVSGSGASGAAAAAAAMRLEDDGSGGGGGSAAAAAAAAAAGSAACTPRGPPPPPSFLAAGFSAPSPSVTGTCPNDPVGMDQTPAPGAPQAELSLGPPVHRSDSHIAGGAREVSTGTTATAGGGAVAAPPAELEVSHGSAVWWGGGSPDIALAAVAPGCVVLIRRMDRRMTVLGIPNTQPHSTQPQHSATGAGNAGAGAAAHDLAGGVAAGGADTAPRVGPSRSRRSRKRPRSSCTVLELGTTAAELLDHEPSCCALRALPPLPPPQSPPSQPRQPLSRRSPPQPLSAFAVAAAQHAAVAAAGHSGLRAGGGTGSMPGPSRTTGGPAGGQEPAAGAAATAAAASAPDAACVPGLPPLPPRPGSAGAAAPGSLPLRQGVGTTSTTPVSHPTLYTSASSGGVLAAAPPSAAAAAAPAPSWRYQLLVGDHAPSIQVLLLTHGSVGLHCSRLAQISTQVPRGLGPVEGPAGPPPAAVPECITFVGQAPGPVETAAAMGAATAAAAAGSFLPWSSAAATAEATTEAAEAFLCVAGLRSGGVAAYGYGDGYGSSSSRATVAPGFEGRSGIADRAAVGVGGGVEGTDPAPAAMVVLGDLGPPGTSEGAVRASGGTGPEEMDTGEAPHMAERHSLSSIDVALTPPPPPPSTVPAGGGSAAAATATTSTAVPVAAMCFRRLWHCQLEQVPVRLASLAPCRPWQLLAVGSAVHLVELAAVSGRLVCSPLLPAAGSWGADGAAPGSAAAADGGSEAAAPPPPLQPLHAVPLFVPAPSSLAQPNQQPHVREGLKGQRSESGSGLRLPPLASRLPAELALITLNDGSWRLVSLQRVGRVGRQPPSMAALTAHDGAAGLPLPPPNGGRMALGRPRLLLRVPPLPPAAPPAAPAQHGGIAAAGGAGGIDDLELVDAAEGPSTSQGPAPKAASAHMPPALLRLGSAGGGGAARREIACGGSGDAAVVGSTGTCDGGYLVLLADAVSTPPRPADGSEALHVLEESSGRVVASFDIAAATGGFLATCGEVWQVGPEAGVGTGSDRQRRSTRGYSTGGGSTDMGDGRDDWELDRLGAAAEGAAARAAGGAWARAAFGRADVERNGEEDVVGPPRPPPPPQAAAAAARGGAARGAGGLLRMQNWWPGALRAHLRPAERRALEAALAEAHAGAHGEVAEALAELHAIIAVGDDGEARRAGMRPGGAAAAAFAGAAAAGGGEAAAAGAGADVAAPMDEDGGNGGDAAELNWVDNDAPIGDGGAAAAGGNAAAAAAAADDDGRGGNRDVEGPDEALRQPQPQPQRQLGQQERDDALWLRLRLGPEHFLDEDEDMGQLLWERFEAQAQAEAAVAAAAEGEEQAAAAAAAEAAEELGRSGRAAAAVAAAAAAAPPLRGEPATLLVVGCSGPSGGEVMLLRVTAAAAAPPPLECSALTHLAGSGGAATAASVVHIQVVLRLLLAKPVTAVCPYGSTTLAVAAGRRLLFYRMRDSRLHRTGWHSTRGSATALAACPDRRLLAASDGATGVVLYSVVHADSDVPGSPEGPPVALRLIGADVVHRPVTSLLLLPRTNATALQAAAAPAPAEAGSSGSAASPASEESMEVQAADGTAAAAAAATAVGAVAGSAGATIAASTAPPVIAATDSSGRLVLLSPESPTSSPCRNLLVVAATQAPDAALRLRGLMQPPLARYNAAQPQPPAAPSLLMAGLCGTLHRVRPCPDAAAPLLAMLERALARHPVGRPVTGGRHPAAAEVAVEIGDGSGDGAARCWWWCHHCHPGGVLDGDLLQLLLDLPHPLRLQVLRQVPAEALGAALGAAGSGRESDFLEAAAAWDHRTQQAAQARAEAEAGADGEQEAEGEVGAEMEMQQQGSGVVGMLAHLERADGLGGAGSGLAAQEAVEDARRWVEMDAEQGGSGSGIGERVGIRGSQDGVCEGGAVGPLEREGASEAGRLAKGAAEEQPQDGYEEMLESVLQVLQDVLML